MMALECSWSQEGAVVDATDAWTKAKVGEALEEDDADDIDDADALLLETKDSSLNSPHHTGISRRRTRNSSCLSSSSGASARSPAVCRQQK
jgi:hypothetical protein